MATGRQKDPDDVAELLRTMLITQLALAGVRQRNIRAVVRCDLNHVTRVLKQMDLKNTAGKKGAT
jgi:hypothetical protein